MRIRSLLSGKKQLRVIFNNFKFNQLKVMCGIAGILRFDGSSVIPDDIKKMTNEMSHRGPDGEGYFVFQNVALGHRRLSIIDIETGKQPMTNEDKSIWITYNGELYNYKRLKEELEQKKHIFTTKSDTEVIVHAFEEWGSDCVKKFRGMFAFAIVDLNAKCIFLARDHFGIKPLCYRQEQNYFAFASEINPLISCQDLLPTGNLLAIEFFLRYQYIPTPLTIYKEIKKLPPGHFLKCNFDGTLEGPTCFWDLNVDNGTAISLENSETEAEKIISESISAHLISDVPFGVFLSGGIDSTLIALKMQKLLGKPVEAFAIGFDQRDYDELEYAKTAAKTIGVNLHIEVVTEDILAVLPDLIRHYGEPFGDSSALPTWCVARLARKFVPMVLSGDGGDEMFAGYDSYRYWMIETSIPEIMSYSFSNFPKCIIPGFSMMKNKLFSGMKNTVESWEKYITYTQYAERKRIWLHEYHFLLNKSPDIFKRAEINAKSEGHLGFAQHIDKMTYLPCDILTKVDIASMYHGLEVRVPLIDLRVNKFASNLPLKQRMGLNPANERTGKILLKNLLIADFDNDFVYRKKKGFGIPGPIWFLPEHKAREMLEKLLIEQRERLSQFFNTERIEILLQKHSLKSDYSGILWLILVLGIWFEQNPNISFMNSTEISSFNSSDSGH
jgi:asparagine synthase (glutamine-hydrolysing)